MPIRYDTLIREARAAGRKIVNRDKSRWSIVSTTGGDAPPRAICVSYARADGTTREIHWREKGGYPFTRSALVQPRNAKTDPVHQGNVSGKVRCDDFDEEAVLELYRQWLSHL